MQENLRATPTATLASEARRLELRLIDGTAIDDEVDAFMRIAMELGSRHSEAETLETVLDPRD
jgi:hypothetical protein